MVAAGAASALTAAAKSSESFGGASGSNGMGAATGARATTAGTGGVLAQRQGEDNHGWGETGGTSHALPYTGTSAVL